MNKEKNTALDYSRLSSVEWLQTNGIGGWASASICGTNTRRYHGLLMSANGNGMERTLLVSKLDEIIDTGEQVFDLSTNQYEGAISPNGFQYLSSFKQELYPEWEYKCGGLRIRKSINMVYGGNTTIISYEVVEADSEFDLKLFPLVSARGYHALDKAGNHRHWDASFENGIWHNRPDGVHDIFICIPGASYTHNPNWYYNFYYSREKYRGLDHTEDLFNHGYFTTRLAKNQTINIILSDTHPGIDVKGVLEKEKSRKLDLVKDSQDPFVARLQLAADQFVVKKQIGKKDFATIIAGYHWFTDWGRDTMISLPGLCLATGRYEEAKKILEAFAASVSMGMLPNRFQDDGNAEYNNVDGTLWFFIALKKYFDHTGDQHFLTAEMLPVLKDIISWHFSGTRYNIKMDADGLLWSGEPGVQLTWMDAKIGDWVVTPRTGKAVEIQALWYNTLLIYAEILEMAGEIERADFIKSVASTTKRSFAEKFWSGKNYLYDVINENGEDESIRPNQIFALSLPYQLISGDKAVQVLQSVTEQLYTPVGLRTLPMDDPRYVAVYGGDPWKRDAAYHQGTVWPWLLGGYIDAIINVKGDKGKEEAKKVIENFRYHLDEACIGSVSEIFDASPPHLPRGCVAQAWSVAELLRVIKQYGLL